MTIYKTSSLVETYRCKSFSNDMNELNGRPNRPDLTLFVADQILKMISLEKKNSGRCWLWRCNAT